MWWLCPKDLHEAGELSGGQHELSMKLNLLCLSLRQLAGTGVTRGDLATVLALRVLRLLHGSGSSALSTAAGAGVGEF